MNVPELITAVETWEDTMKSRTALDLRIQGIKRAGGTPAKELEAALRFQTSAKREFEKLIRKEWRKHPLAPWAKDIRGLGEHSVAYLMAKLNGSARWAYPKFWVEGNGSGHKRELHLGEPYERSLSQLWSYCTVGDPARKRHKGMTQEEAFGLGNQAIGPRLHLIAESFIKSRNERYRLVYDERRLTTASREWTDGHSHNDALRIIKKTFLADLYDAEGATCA